MFVADTDLTNNGSSTRLATANIKAISKIEVIAGSEHTRGFYIVGLGYLRFRLKQGLAVLGVVGQNQKPGGIHIQTANREYPAI